MGKVSKPKKPTNGYKKGKKKAKPRTTVRVISAT